MDESLDILLLLLPGLVPLGLLVWGILMEKFRHTLPQARTIRVVGTVCVALGVLLPYVVLLVTEFDAYVFAGQSSTMSSTMLELGLRAGGFGFAGRIVSGFLALLLLWWGGRSDVVHQSAATLRVLISAAGLLFGFFLLSGVGDLVALWGSLEILVLSALRGSIAGTGFRAVYMRGGYYSAIGAMGLVLFYGLFGTTSFNGIETALATQNVEIAPVQSLLLAILLLLGGFIARIGSSVAGVLEGKNTRSSGVIALLVMLAGAVLVVRMFTEIFPAHLFGIRLVDVVLFAGGLIGLVSVLLAIGSEDRVRTLCLALGGHLGLAILGFASGSAGTLFGSGTWMLLHIVLTAGALYLVTAESPNGRADEGGAAGGPIRKALAAVLFLVLAGMPFTGGFFSRIVLIGAVNYIPDYLRIRPMPRHFFGPLSERASDLFGSAMPLVIVSAALAVLLLYAYGRLFRGLYFVKEGEAQDPHNTL